MTRTKLVLGLSAALGIILIAKSTLGTKASTPTPQLTAIPITQVKQKEVADTLNVTTVQNINTLNVDINRTVMFNTEVGTEAVEYTIGFLNAANASSHDPIYLLLDSPGGSVFDGTRLMDYIKASKAPVYTVVYGLCASMCAHIHQSGKVRFMLPSGILMFHPASGAVRGQIGQMEALLGFVRLSVDRLDGAVADRAGIDRAKWQTMIQNELWLAGPEALKLKLTDKLGVVTPRQDQMVQNLSVNQHLKKSSTPNVTAQGIKLNPLADFR